MIKLKKHTSSIINPNFFTFFFIFHQCFCFDKNYESCVPKDCGDGRNISYPFWINGLQDPTCGYPGFELRCNINGSATLQISENKFIIKQIEYKNKKIRLQNAAILSNRSDYCLPKMTNITLDPNRFTIDNNSSRKLIMISNCSGNFTVNSEKYKVRSCNDSTRFVVLKSDENLRNVTRDCGGSGEIVEIPVELGSNTMVDGGNYTEVVNQGFVLRWLAADCDQCESSGGRCGFNMTAFQFRCFCPDRPHRVSCKPVRTHNCETCLEKHGQCQIHNQKYQCVEGLKAKEKNNHSVITIAVVVGFSLILTLVIAIFFIHRKFKPKAFAYFSKDLEDPSVYFGASVFSYAELEDATNHFDCSKELGDGGFGTVYYGKLRDGREVAVKRLYEHNYKRVQQFMNEVEILTRLRHKNLVSLYGCTSRKSRELLLVYEYIPNGTVSDHLHGDRAKPSPLTWQTRMKIAIETANALVYLHASEIIHRDVKTNNILLDNNFCVKVADFGLSRLLPNDVTHVSTAPQGTPGYVDPEYHQCYQLTDKSDVYSFGVVLIELISSMPAIDISRSRDEIVLANMAINRIQKCALDELIDPFLGSDPDTERMTTSVAELAFQCLQFDSETRPTMVEVLEVLKGIEESVNNVGESTIIKSEIPPPSPETEYVGLLKGGTTASPISVTAKWHSASSGSFSSNTSVLN